MLTAPFNITSRTNHNNPNKSGYFDLTYHYEMPANDLEVKRGDTVWVEIKYFAHSQWTDFYAAASLEKPDGKIKAA
ncbi:MAG TPA: hypothetical protein PKE06_03655 [Flavilitoribacter sp.]|nr:hypothetical protein [Flavilitoribacter sp.]HMQ88741.1 hypothetical protein [Flavilitoribacter sp.]